MKIRILTPEKIVFEGEGDDVVLTGYRGQLNLLNQHANFITKLQAGRVRIRKKSAKDRQFEVSDGFLKVEDYKLSLLTSQAEGLE